MLSPTRGGKFDENYLFAIRYEAYCFILSLRVRSSAPVIPDHVPAPPDELRRHRELLHYARFAGALGAPALPPCEVPTAAVSSFATAARAPLPQTSSAARAPPMALSTDGRGVHSDLYDAISGSGAAMMDVEEKVKERWMTTPARSLHCRAHSGEDRTICPGGRTPVAAAPSCLGQ